MLKLVSDFEGLGVSRKLSSYITKLGSRAEVGVGGLLPQTIGGQGEGEREGIHVHTHTRTSKKVLPPDQQLIYYCSPL